MTFKIKYVSQVLRHGVFFLCVCKMNSLVGIQYKIESLIGIPNVEVISKAKFMSLISYQASVIYFPQKEWQ